MKPGFTVRPATREDIVTLVQLMHDFYAEAHHPLDRAWAAASFDALLSQAALGSVWLALQPDGQAVGHLVLVLRYAMEHGGLSAQIDDLYVQADCRRRGAASALLDAAQAECRARGCKSWHVEVGRDNKAALALYARYGLSAPSDGRVQLGAVLLPLST